LSGLWGFSGVDEYSLAVVGLKAGGCVLGLIIFIWIRKMLLND